MPRRRGIRAGAITALCAVMLGGCGQSTAPAAPAPLSAPAAPAPGQAAPVPGAPVAAAQPEPAPAVRVPMRLSYPSTGPSTAAIWVAADAGFYERNGITAEVTYVESSTTTLQALVSGGLDVAQGSGSAAVQGALAGTDTVSIVGLFPVLPYKLMVAPAIAQPADLRGKRVGISRYGSSSDFGARVILKHLGLRPEEDTAILQVGGQSGRLGALQQGAIDGGVFEAPYDVVLAREGYRELADSSGLLPYAHGVVFTTRTYFQQQEQPLRQLTKALVETIAFMKREREATRQIIAKYTQEDDPVALDEAYRVAAEKYLPQVPYVSLDAIRSVLDEIALTNPAAVGQDPARFIDDRYVRELDQSGYVASLYR
jgi:NitT/TauT family transport system substrate-binding protein